MDQEPADPYLWLEDVHADRALAWAAERTAEADTAFSSPARDVLQRRLQEVLDDPARLVVPRRRGQWMYDLRRDAEHPRGLWRRTSHADFQRGTPTWQTLLDVDALGEREGATWSFSRAVHGPDGSGRVLLHLSPDGGDATVVREFDLDALTFVDTEPFTLAAHKTHTAWIDRDTILIATALHGGASTTSGYPRTARTWRRGTDLADAPVAGSANADDVGVFVSTDRSSGRPVAAVEVARDFFHAQTWVWDADDPAAEPELLDVPQDAHADPHGELVAIRTTTAWGPHPGGTLLVGPRSAAIAGDPRRLSVAFTPTAHTVLQSWTWTRTRLVLTVLDDVRSRIISLDPHDADDLVPLDTGIEGDDLLSVDSVSTEPAADDEVWLLARGFLTPPTLVVTDAARPDPHVTDRAPAVFDTTGLSTTQHWAVSADGTRVPYFEIGPTDRQGPRPTLMNGYGGFEHALTPEYATLVGPAWLERGNTYVVANIRGGGEFGPDWHLAALREKRHRAYEDFAAVAEDLARRGVARPDQIGCHGRSNGGLLVGNMLTGYPDRFGAIVCGVPLLDMRRYTRLSAGASWIAEYGDPDDPQDWAFIQTFSPYHRIEPGRTYPPSLIYAATSDDRVGPVQARKMAARLAEIGAPVHYLEPTEGGHAGTVDNAATAALHASIYAFLDTSLPAS